MKELTLTQTQVLQRHCADRRLQVSGRAVVRGQDGGRGHLVPDHKLLGEPSTVRCILLAETQRELLKGRIVMTAPTPPDRRVPRGASISVGRWVLVPIDQGTKGRTSKLEHAAALHHQPEQCTRVRPTSDLAHALQPHRALDLVARLRRGSSAAGRVPRALWPCRRGAHLLGRPNRAPLALPSARWAGALTSKALCTPTGLNFVAPLTGSQSQTILPQASPDTMRPWVYGDPLVNDWRELPTLPTGLLTIWQELVRPDRARGRR